MTHEEEYERNGLSDAEKQICRRLDAQIDGWIVLIQVSVIGGMVCAVFLIVLAILAACNIL